MMDDREDRLDEQLRELARDYNTPPTTPRAELWERIRAARAAELSPTARPAIPLFRRPLLRFAMGIAALLALGIAIGRFTAPTGSRAPSNPGTLAAGPEKRDRGVAAARFATNEHLSRVETFLTEFGVRPSDGGRSGDFSGRAQDLLSTTRLLLDSKRVTDARTRQLLQDLELVLVQIATIDPKDRREELDLIADGLAQKHLRSRLRNAIPTEPAIRM